MYNITSINLVVYDNEDEVFYILANKFEERLGFFVIKIGEHNPFDG